MDREAVLEATAGEKFVSEYERERGKPMPSLNHGTVQLRLGSELLNRYGNDYSVISEVTLDTSPPMTPDLCIYPTLQLNWTRDRRRGIGFVWQTRPFSSWKSSPLARALMN